MPSIRVAAVGHRDRRDDGAGPEVVRRLAGRLPADATATDLGPNPLGLLEVFDDATAVIVTDAVASGAAPGTVHRLVGAEAVSRAADLRGTTSSHGIDLAATLALAEQLGRLPDKLLVVGIEAEDVSPGRGLSPPVAAAVDTAAAVVLEEIESLAGEGSRRP